VKGTYNDAAQYTPVAQLRQSHKVKPPLWSILTCRKRCSVDTSCPNRSIPVGPPRSASATTTSTSHKLDEAARRHCLLDHCQSDSVLTKNSLSKCSPTTPAVEIHSAGLLGSSLNQSILLLRIMNMLAGSSCRESPHGDCEEFLPLRVLGAWLEQVVATIAQFSFDSLPLDDLTNSPHQ
jgi:hypothetical protein